MSSSRQCLSILDVGHGNTTVLEDEHGVVVIDAGPGSSLLEFLKQEGIGRVDVLLISHADKDHIEGLLALVTCEEFEIGRVRLNTDPRVGREGKLWKTLLYALDKSHLERKVDFDVHLTEADTGTFNQGSVDIQILAPTLGIAGIGPGGTDFKGRELSSNSMSVVIKLVHDGIPLALLPGDMDGVGLDNIVESGHDCRAYILIFPHHGGRPGAADITAFTERICRLVEPRCVIFSIGRNQHGTPRPEVVSTIKTHLPDARIACTQLSLHCAAELPSITDHTHMTNRFSKGREKNQCCAGTFVVDFEDIENLLPHREAHQEFIRINAPSALCRIAGVSPRTE
jgi:beta-lactamase superfamily II metal-dependent hydrolase